MLIHGMPCLSSTQFVLKIMPGKHQCSAFHAPHWPYLVPLHGQRISTHAPKFPGGPVDSRVASEGGELPLWRPDVPCLHRFVYGPRRKHAVVVLAPVCSQHLMCMGCQAERRPRLPQVPQLHCAVARAAEEHVAMCGIPAALTHAEQHSGSCVRILTNSGTSIRRFQGWKAASKPGWCKYRSLQMGSC